MVGGLIDNAVNAGVENAVSGLVPCFPVWQPEVDTTLHMSQASEAVTSGFANPFLAGPNTDVVIDTRS